MHKLVSAQQNKPFYQFDICHKKLHFLLSFFFPPQNQINLFFFFFLRKQCVLFKMRTRLWVNSDKFSLMKTPTMTLTSLLEYTYTILSVFFNSVFRMVMVCVKETFNVCALVKSLPCAGFLDMSYSKAGFLAACRVKLVWFYSKPKSGAKFTIRHGFYGALRFCHLISGTGPSPRVIDCHIWGFISCT